MNLEKASRYAMSLPGVTEEPHHEMSSFRVMGKIFATVPPGGQHLHVFVDEPEREQAIALEPLAYEKLHWGSKVVGVRVVLAEARAPAVEALLRKAWTRKAPKKLIAGS